MRLCAWVATEVDVTLGGTTETLTIAAEQTSGSVDVSYTPVANNIDAPDLTVPVTGTTSAAGLTVTDTSFVVIDDDPAPTVTLSLSPDSVGENGGVSTVTASLSHASSAATTVTISAVAVSPAVAGDFTLSGTTLTIAAGATSSTGTVTVTANDNDLDAPDKSVTVSATASNTRGVAGDPASLTLTIKDDDPPPTVSLSSSSESVDEGAGTVSLTVSLSAASGEEVTVDYATADGTAESGTGKDYTAASGTLTFAAGDASKTISVSVTDDSIDEPDETFTVSLSSPSNATLGSTASSTVTITDNDMPSVTVSYASATYEATEGGSAATVTVQLSAAPGQEVVIPIVATAGGGATAQGEDGGLFGHSGERDVRRDGHLQDVYGDGDRRCHRRRWRERRR